MVSHSFASANLLQFGLKMSRDGGESGQILISGQERGRHAGRGGEETLCLQYAENQIEDEIMREQTKIGK
jgi:hypothetical protein